MAFCAVTALLGVLCQFAKSRGPIIFLHNEARQDPLGKLVIANLFRVSLKCVYGGGAGGRIVAGKGRDGARGASRKGRVKEERLIWMPCRPAHPPSNNSSTDPVTAVILRCDFC